MSNFDALVLAGSRGTTDPLAQQQGVQHRALLEIDGVPMLLRVVRSLRAASRIDGIALSIDDPAALSAVPELAANGVEVHCSLSSPSRSVLDVLERRADAGKLLVTTADHPLLTPEIIDHFAAADDGSSADVLVGVVARSLLREHFPDSTRTWLPLRGDRYTGANLFAFRTPEARRAARFWLRAERFRKRPWRLASVFGPGTLLAFALRRLDLDAALERVSQAMQARVEAVRLPFAEAAIDVDRPADLALVSRILAGDQSRRSPSSVKRSLAES